MGEQYGYRNAQVTVIAPTGTIGLSMDCDTTGIEPDFALVKFKKLAGGGYLEDHQRLGSPGLEGDGLHHPADRRYRALLQRDRLTERLPAHQRGLARKPKGFTDEVIAKVEAALPQAFEISFAFNQWTLGEEFCKDNAQDQRRAAQHVCVCVSRSAHFLSYIYTLSNYTHTHTHTHKYYKV